MGNKPSAQGPLTEQEAHDAFHIALEEAVEGLRHEVAFATEAIEVLLPALESMLTVKRKVYAGYSVHWRRRVEEDLGELHQMRTELFPAMRKTSILYERLLARVLWPEQSQMRLDEVATFRRLEQRRGVMAALEARLREWVEAQREMLPYQDPERWQGRVASRCQADAMPQIHRAAQADAADREAIAAILGEEERQVALQQHEAALRRGGLPEELVRSIVSSAGAKNEAWSGWRPTRS